jgi:hypothetical protein
LGDGVSGLALVTSLALSGGCAQAARAGDLSQDAASIDGGPAGTLADASAADSGGSSDDASLLGNPSFGDDSGSGVGSCSADLRSVVDDNGQVIETCADDQGCSNGACIPACDAAAANHGTLGCDFLVSTPAFEVSHRPPCLVVFLTNGWTATATLGVSRGGTSYDPTLFARVPSAGTPPSSWATLPTTGVAPNQVAVLFLSSDPDATNAGTSLDCPVADAIASGTAVWGMAFTDILDGGLEASVTGLGTAWHITSSVPVNGYDVLPFGGARSYLPSAQLLLPTSAWGTNYVAAVPPVGSVDERWGQIIAAQDDTRVELVPTVDLPSGAGVDAAAQNALASFSLNAGEYLQWQWRGSLGDLSGSPISSDKPVLFVGGHGDLCLSSATSTGGGCDSEHELVPPVSAWGREYVGIPYATRRADLQPESIPYRIVGAVDGTILSFDPAAPAVPVALSQGQVVDFEATSAFVVSSQDDQHPFWIAQQMPGCMVTSGSRPGTDPDASLGDCLGDEDDVGMIPPAQWLSRYVFFTDPTYATTNLALARANTPSGFPDVTVDCVGTVSGWQPVGASGNYEVTNIDLVRATTPVGSCQNGPHVATSDGLFTIVVWGLDSYSSYSYPAGGNFKSINTVVVPTKLR